MHSKCFFALALAFLGASTAPVPSAAAVVAGVGPTVSETVITPYHRTDAVSTPCGQSVVRTTAIPVVPYGITAGTGFLGNAGVFPGIIGNGFAETGAGLYPGVVAGQFIGNEGIGYSQGIVGANVYPGVGVGGADVLGGGLGMYPRANFL